ncbi:MAG: hypothetical protein IPP35_01475 [Elusimicrobia bacterium]|nr:hypothetical protein [Elusimicrobiota bacterium]
MTGLLFRRVLGVAVLLSLMLGVTTRAGSFSIRTRARHSTDLRTCS